MAQASLDRYAFKVAIICALPSEADMVESVFDRFWDATSKAPGDPNAYTTGIIGQHNVVLAHMPNMGINSAASVAVGLRTSYQGIRIAFVVGVCGVVPKHPQTQQEILLGDCIISTAMIQYDLGRQYPQGFIRRHNIEDTLGRASIEIRSLTQKLQTSHNKQQLTSSLRKHLQTIVEKRLDVSYPGIQRDRLFEPTYSHEYCRGDTCDACLEDTGICKKNCDFVGCEDERLVKRQRLQLSKGAIDVLPMIHFGRFGSASTVMRSGLDRDRAAKEGQLLAFETEVPGVWDSFPTVVIKSACDYADSHKNKEWQPYASATAAAGLKAFLEFISSNQIHYTETAHNERSVLNRSDRTDQSSETGTLSRRPITSTLSINDTDQPAECPMQENKIRTRISDSWSPTTAWKLLLTVIVLLTSIQFIYKYGTTNHSDGRTRSPLLESGVSRSKEYGSFSNGLGTPEDSRHNLERYMSWPTETYYMMPLLQNQRFVGRGSKLAELEHGLFVSNTTRQLAIFGLGGVGKTQLALEFCYTIKARYPDYSIFWVSALSAARFKEDCNQIAKVYSLPIEGNDVVPIVQNYLSSDAVGKWLLIIDNADDKTTLFEDDRGIVSRLPQSQAGITLFTTRYKDIAFDLAGGHIIKLEEMDLVEARLFLATSLVDSSLTMNEKVVDELLEELACLPLAIAQASSYIIKNSITIATYLILLKGTTNRMAKLLSHDFRDPTRDTRAKNAVAPTWLLSFEQIRRELPEALDVLFFIACIENKNIPVSILPLPDTDMTEIIGILVGCSFLAKSRNVDTYDMHKLVHHAVKIWMQDQDIITLWRNRAVNHLARIFPYPEWEKRALWREITPHAARILQDTEYMVTEQRADLALSLGLSLELDGRPSEAVKWVSQCVSWTEKSLHDDDAMRLFAPHKLARECLLDGRVQETVSILEKVAAMHKRVLAEDHRDQITSQHRLARAYLSSGMVKEAIKILETVVKIKERAFSEDYSFRLASLHQLALAYDLNGQAKQAINIAEQATTIRAKALAEGTFQSIGISYACWRIHVKRKGEKT